MVGLLGVLEPIIKMNKKKCVFRENKLNISARAQKKNLIKLKKKIRIRKIGLAEWKKYIKKIKKNGLNKCGLKKNGSFTIKMCLEKQFSKEKLQIWAQKKKKNGTPTF